MGAAMKVIFRLFVPSVHKALNGAKP
jgi:hypothetical protein